MKNKNTILFRGITFLIISILLLSNISFANTNNDTNNEKTDDTTENITETVKKYGSLNLETGEMKEEIIEHNNSSKKTDTKGYLPKGLKGSLLVGPNNQSDNRLRSIIDDDDRKEIPNQWRNI